jgi:Uma2 family endonuclease
MDDQIKMTVEDYVQFELTAPCRHEYIDGQLIPIPGEQDINNEIAGAIYVLLVSLLSSHSFKVYNHDVKVVIPGSERIYYPDVFATNEPRTEANRYIKHAPAIIAEVVSPHSRIKDTVDKYIDYTKIPELQYYLVVEPETTSITCYSRSQGGEWHADLYTRLSDVIDLPLLGVSLALSVVYKGTL